MTVNSRGATPYELEEYYRSAPWEASKSCGEGFAGFSQVLHPRPNPVRHQTSNDDRGQPQDYGYNL